MSVQRWIGRVIADDVVAGHVFLGLHDTHGKIVIVEQRLPAGIGGERIKRLLLILEIAGYSSSGASRIHALATGRSLGGIAQGSLSHQAPGVDRIKRYIGADS